MTKPTKDLGNEHGAILVFLIIARALAKQLDEGNDVNKKDLEAIVDFVRTFADKCHHAKEEDQVFPQLIKKSKEYAGLVNELLGEHIAGRDFIRGIADSLPQYSAGNPHAIHVSRCLTGYADLLQKHIRTEAERLFPAMEKEFASPEAEKLWEEFKKIEHDVIGEVKHEAYHEWLKEMRAKYA
ncbi:MAG: hemerythrin domain-containing protein [Patescibacteria group bacterium]|nr:hemerythrin domain-containing protein [Patescibacteria group bacterium]MDD5716037.1 hemerythrin domain-containing protein [Patescibacteria group bacterium]